MKIIASLLFVLMPILCFADSVVPIDSVQEHVNIRMTPDATSEIVGRLDQGESVELLSKQGGWYEVVLEGDASGFVSADWTKLAGEELGPEPKIAAQAGGESEEELVDIVEEIAIEQDVVVEVTEAAEDVVEEIAVEEDMVVEVTEAESAAVVEPEIESAVVDEAVEAVSSSTEVLASEDSEPVVVPSQPLVTLKGTRDFLVRFRDPSKGVNSQVFDNGNRVGIGTTTPKQRLEVNGNIQIHEQNSSVAGLMITQSTGETGYIMHNRASTLTIGAGSEDRITIDRHGNVGIGVSRPKHPLEMASGAHVTEGGVWVNSSSRTRKENVVALSGELAKSTLLALEPVQFDYKNGDAERYVGFIAEDVPELVAVNARDGLSAMDIVAVLTRVVQDQQRRIEALERRFDEH